MVHTFWHEGILTWTYSGDIIAELPKLCRSRPSLVLFITRKSEVTDGRSRRWSQNFLSTNKAKAVCLYTILPRMIFVCCVNPLCDLYLLQTHLTRSAGIHGHRMCIPWFKHAATICGSSPGLPAQDITKGSAVKGDGIVHLFVWTDSLEGTVTSRWPATHHLKWTRKAACSVSFFRWFIHASTRVFRVASKYQPPSRK